jgi:hypothetical protein
METCDLRIRVLAVHAQLVYPQLDCIIHIWSISQLLKTGQEMKWYLMQRSSTDCKG